MTVATETRTREQRCEKHGKRVYLQTWFAHFETWIGSCDLCAKDNEVELRARVILATRTTEKTRRTGERCKPDEALIKRETDDAIEAHAQRIVDELEAMRPSFEAVVRRKHWEMAESDVEQEMLAEIQKEIRQ